MGGTKNKKASDGFTVIEVIIVLTIAGLIMVVVFLAVPALQRNTRNQVRRSDARLISTQRFQYNVDNQTTSAGAVVATTCGGTNADTFLFCSYIKQGLGSYTLAGVYFKSNASTKPTTIDAVTDPNQISTVSYTKCDDKSQYAVAGDRKTDMTVTFLIETRTGWQHQCIQNDLAPKS